MSHEFVERQISQLIYRRSHKLDLKIASTINESYRLADNIELPPKVLFPGSVNTFLNSKQLWLEVENVEYTPSELVKSFIVRKDGSKKDSDLFSVFIADRKRYIAEKWGIKPLSSWNKQKYQYWDKGFVTAVFTYMVVCEESDWKNKNKIEWKINDKLTLGEMQKKFKESNIKTAEVIGKKRV